MATGNVVKRKRANVDPLDELAGTLTTMTLVPATTGMPAKTFSPKSPQLPLRSKSTQAETMPDVAATTCTVATWPATQLFRNATPSSSARLARSSPVAEASGCPSGSESIKAPR